MKFSIVTISFNQSIYLQECINSVLSQKFHSLEYIIVDPGSGDGSRNIIKSYGDNLLKIFEPDTGPPDGLNKGFNVATGDIYCYLNSDDLLLPGSLQKVADYFSSNPDVDIIYGNGKIIDDVSNFKRNVYSDKFNIHAAAYGASLIVQPSTFYRSKIFKSGVMFNVRNKSNWDGELFIDAALAGAKLLKVNEFFSCYRIHSDSITGSGRLLEEHSHYTKRMFVKIYKKQFTAMNNFFYYFYKIRKHFLNPIATYERFKSGPIFGNH